MNDGKDLRGVMKLGTALDPIALNIAPRDLVADAAHAALFPVQDIAPHLAVLGTAVLLVTLCTRCGIKEEDVLGKAYRILNVQEFDKRANDSLQSLRDFAGIRFMGQETTIS